MKWNVILLLSIFISPISLKAQPIQAQTIPLIIPHSGTVSVEGQPFSGQGQFKFAIINIKGCGFQTGDGCISYWSNDGTSTLGSEPDLALTLSIANGIFALKLGDEKLSNMASLPMTVFDQSETYLRIWFDDGVNGFQRMAPDRQLASVPYAYRAEVATSLEGTGIVGSAQISPGAVIGGLAGSIEDGSITGADLSNNAVGGPQIASNSVSEAHLTFETANQAELDALGNTGTINTPANPLHWTQLKGVPGGLADGVDNDTVLVESDPKVGSLSNGFVPKWDGAQLADGLIFHDGGNLSIGSSGAGLRITPDQGGSIELGATNGSLNPTLGGSPFIDFHYGTGNPEDFNARIINSGNGRLQLETSPSTNGQIGLTIVNNTVGIGLFGGGVPQEKLHVNGNILAISTLYTSDKRYKSDIKILSHPLDTLLRLRGVNFSWRKDRFPEKQFSDALQIGLIAQEVRDVLPELVFEDSQGMLSVNYTNVIPVLIEAIKEQQTQIENLKAKTSEITMLRQEILELKQLMEVQIHTKIIQSRNRKTGNQNKSFPWFKK